MFQSVKKHVQIFVDPFDLRRVSGGYNEAFVDYHDRAFAKLPSPPLNHKWGPGVCKQETFCHTHPEGMPVVWEFVTVPDPGARRRRRKESRKRWAAYST